MKYNTIMPATWCEIPTMKESVSLRLEQEGDALGWTLAQRSEDHHLLPDHQDAPDNAIWQSENRLSQKQRNWRDRFYIRESGTIVGLMELDRGPNNTAWVGYEVGARYRGHGYATLALIAVSRHAREHKGFSVVQLHIESTNSASLRVAEKAGFTHGGLSPANPNYELFFQ